MVDSYTSYKAHIPSNKMLVALNRNTCTINKIHIMTTKQTNNAEETKTKQRKTTTFLLLR